MSDYRGLQALFRAIDWGTHLEARAAVERASLPTGAVPEGWVIGKAFIFVAEGRVFDRWEGHQRGLDVTADDIDSALAIWRSGDTSCAIDYEHDEDRPIGLVVAMWRVDRGGKAALACLPAYSPEGAELVGNASHLWSSPHLYWNATTATTTRIGADGSESEGETSYERRPYVAADTGETVGGSMMIPHLAVCKDPAQSHRVLTAVRLSEQASDSPPISAMGVTEQEHGMDPEELKALLDAIMSRLDAIEQAVSALQEGKASDDEGEAEMSEDGGEKASEEMKSEALSAENRALRERVRKLEEGQRLSAREARIGACLSSGRMTPAERKTAEKAYDRDPGLFAEIYEARLSGSMVPTLKGHGQIPEVKLSAEPRAERAEQIQATSKVGYIAALTKAAGEV